MKLYNIALLIIFSVSMLHAQHNWSVNISDYQSTMYLTGKVVIDNEYITDTTITIGVFYNDECRGISNIHYYATSDTYRVSVQIYGNDQNESLKIKAYLPGDNSTLTLDNEITFQSGEILGSVEHPVILHSGEYTSINQGQITSVQIYPNPVKNSFQLTTDRSIESIELFSVSGIRVKTFTPAQRYSVSELPEGLYLASFRFKDGGEIIKRLVVSSN